MPSLCDFDFESVDPIAFEDDKRSLANPALLNDLDRASTSGDLSAVAENLSRLRKSNPASNILQQHRNTLRLAIQHQHESVIQFLLSQGAEIYSDHIRIATTNKARSTILALLQHGWPVNERLGWSDPPALAYAVEDYSLTAWLLDQGAYPNAPCGLDKTPLSAAVQYGSLSTIQMLFARGGSIRHGQLLHYAIWRTEDRTAVVQYLLDLGAPLNVLMYHDKPDSYAQRAAFGLGTPLHDAAALGDTDVLQLLIARGANLLLRDSRGCMAYERAQANDHQSAAQLLLSSSRASL